MFMNFVSAAALFGAIVRAMPAFPLVQETSREVKRPAPPQAALRPLWVEGSQPTRPDTVVILPTGTAEVADLTDDVSVLATLADTYTFWQGNGVNWPKKDAWGDIDQLWNANLPLIRQSCGWNGWGADNSESEISYMNTAIRQVASETGLEARFILATIMQETGGCVRAPTTDNGVRNPGLMQSHNGAGTCAGVNPCPNAQILQMIRDGSAGTTAGDGLKQCLAKTTSVLSDAPYRATFAAARMYNSGSVDYNDLNNPFTSRKCYACDIANRFTGWTYATRTCA